MSLKDFLCKQYHILTSSASDFVDVFKDQDKATRGLFPQGLNASEFQGTFC